MYRVLLVIYLLFFFSDPFYTQTKGFYDNDLLTKEFHRGRREALRNLLPDSSIAVFFSNPIRNKSNDINYDYHQNPDFYYLTGLTEPNSMLIIFKSEQDFDSVKTNEVLFIQEKDEFKERWTGRNIGIADAKEKLGFSYVLSNKDFSNFKWDTTSIKKTYHPMFYDDVRDDNTDKGDLYSLIKHFKLKTKNTAKVMLSFDLMQMMAKLREVKTNEEIGLIKAAVNMSCEAHLESMKALEPGMTEYQVQSIIEYYLKNRGAETVAYPSIIGGGENSCIAHYVSNRKLLEGKDMLVIDAGAEYHGYAADITRTLPVDGKFSAEETIIYNIVLEAQTAGIKMCKKGNDFRAPHNAAVAVVQKRLLEYGIIKTAKEYNKYFFHGTSHYLGLDVHDAGLFGKLMPGSIITVEPGVYIPVGADCDQKWWNIGVRIEDDVLITDTNPEVLSGSLPKKTDEIEAIMQNKSLFNELNKSNNK